jgi:hypothetical protein
VADVQVEGRDLSEGRGSSFDAPVFDWNRPKQTLFECERGREPIRKGNPRIAKAEQ